MSFIKQSNWLMIAAAAFFVVPVVFSILYVEGPFVTSGQGKTLTANEIIEVAKKNLGPLVLPPRPEGQTHTEGSKREIVTKVPSIVGGFPPRVEMKEVRTTVDVPRVVIEPPSSERVAEWQKNVEFLQDEYNKMLERQVQRIEKQNETYTKSSLSDWIDTAVKFSGMFFGLVAMIMSIRVDRRARTELELKLRQAERELLATTHSLPSDHRPATE